MSASQLPSAHATTARAAGSGSPKPTIVLEHGSWADASSWNAVIRRLQRDGYTVYAPPNPLRGLGYDSATLADFLATIPGPIVLAGHSYGGMVITNAAAGNLHVKALVYDDAFIPAQGDPVFGLTATQPGSCLGSDGFNPVPSPGSPATDPDIYLKVAPSGTYPGFDQCFANGVPAAQAAVLAATQRPSALSAGSAPSGVPAWKTIPSWAVVGTGRRQCTPQGNSVSQTPASAPSPRKSTACHPPMARTPSPAPWKRSPAWSRRANSGCLSRRASRSSRSAPRPSSRPAGT